MPRSLVGFFRCKVCFANHHNDVKCKHDPRRDSNISGERLGYSEWPLMVCLEEVYESEEIEWREGRMQDAFEGIINVQQSAYVGTWITASLVLKQTFKEKRSLGSPASDTDATMPPTVAALSVTVVVYIICLTYFQTRKLFLGFQ